MIFEYDMIKYDPVVDEAEVDQFGFVDLREAWENKTVVGNLDVDTMNFNEIDDAEAVLKTPKNIFEGVTMSHAIAASLDHANESSEG